MLNRRSVISRLASIGFSLNAMRRRPAKIPGHSVLAVCRVECFSIMTINRVQGLQ